MKIIKDLQKKVKAKKKAKWLKGCCAKFKGNKSLLKKLLITTLVLVLLYLFRGQFIVATVNGQPITRWKLRKALESQAGTQILEGLITESLISQERRKKNIQISPEEINQEIEKIKETLTAQGQDFEALLQMQGVDLEEVKKQMALQKVIEKLAGDDIEVTQEEVDQYLEENKDILPEDQEGLEEQVKETLRQDKANLGIQEVLADLKEKATINYWREL